MFYEIEELQDLATAVDEPFSDTKLVTLGIDLIKNTSEKGLTEWYKKKYQSRMEALYATF